MHRLLTPLLVSLVLTAQVAEAQPSPKTAPIITGALPYDIRLEELSFVAPNLVPAIHSYNLAASKGRPWLIFGGRRMDQANTPGVGLHAFQKPPLNNFVGPNHWMLVVDPEKGLLAEFDTTTLATNLSLPLQTSNGQGWLDRATDQYYYVGGYGPTSFGDPNPDFDTFATLLRFPLGGVIDAILTNHTDLERAQVIQGLIQFGIKPNLAITGGELFRPSPSGIGVSTNETDPFFLVFGQTAHGRYSAFTGFNQTYSCAVRTFRINPNNFSGPLLSYAEILKDEQNFHRRDGNIINTLDPASGAPLIGAFGGVFVPGVIGAYTNPVYLSGVQTSRVDSAFAQQFGAYECPVVGVYDASQQKMYHTFIGGISHYFYYQSAQHGEVYDAVTTQGRNDGMPFVEDITTLVRGADGQYSEWIHPDPIPAIGFPPTNLPTNPVTQYNPGSNFVSNLRGASTKFIPNRALTGGILNGSGIVQLDQMNPGQTIVAGYMYGGIEAEYPLPVIPSTGTKASRAFYRILISRRPASAIPAKYATVAIGTPTAHSK